LFLSQGYAVASSTLNVPETNCSIVISGEAAMMVKEHFIETYGPLRYTIGWGGSGGSISQHDIADGYPGILDGLIPGVSYPDMLTPFTSAADCSALNRYFATSSLTEAQKTAISGYVSSSPCISWQAGFLPKMTPTGSCNRAPGAPIPPSALWDPVTNPTGIKCMAAEQWVNQLGRDPRTGLVRSTRDNVGVQYGLQALRSGVISAAQFADLNAKVGGVNEVGTLVDQRVVADPLALSIAYRDNLWASGGLGLRSTPIIDQRTYADRGGFGVDIHTAEMSFVTRDRLLKANGTAANQDVGMSKLKCALKPLDLNRYGVAFSAADKAKLRQTFPGGVCDYSRPGIGQQPASGTWIDYTR